MKENRLITLKVKHTPDMILQPRRKEREEMRLAYMEDFLLTLNVLNELHYTGEEARKAGSGTTVGIFTDAEQQGAIIIMEAYTYLDNHKADWSMIKIAKMIEKIADLENEKKPPKKSGFEFLPR